MCLWRWPYVWRSRVGIVLTDLSIAWKALGEYSLTKSSQVILSVAKDLHIGVGRRFFARSE